MVERLKNLKFYSLLDAKKLLKEIENLEEKLTQVNDSLLRDLLWPETKISSLRIVVKLYERIEATFDIW